MAKKEAKTDLWVYELLQEANIKLTPQGCDIKEINEALKTASKSNTGNAGYPEYCGVVKDFILVIEDKASLDKHLYKDEKGIIAQDVKAVKNYAVNGALFYARHLATKTSYNKVLAIGVSGNEKHHRITPIFVNERDDYQVLSDVETFISFSKNNIDEYYYSLKSATKLFSVLLASKRPLITELADKLRLKYPLLPTISPCPTMRLEAIRSIIPISCRRYPKSV